METKEANIYKKLYQANVTDINEKLFQTTLAPGFDDNEISMLTMQDLDTLARKALIDEIRMYFIMQEPEFRDEICKWVTDAPRDEWVPRLVFLKLRNHRHGYWADNWSDLYDKIKRNKPQPGRSEEDVARSIRTEAESVKNDPFYNRVASKEPRKAAKMVESHTNIFRRIPRRLWPAHPPEL